MRKFRPGVSFSDFVVSDMRATKSKIEDDTPRDYRRGWLIWVGVVVLMAVLLVRLLTIQVFYAARYKVLADQNRIKKIKLTAPRGIITDRNGVELARNVLQGDSYVREYPLGEAGVHAVGYVGQVKEDEVGILKEAGGKYDPGDMIGRSGIEAVYEKRLRGLDGGRLVEVDNGLNEVRQLGKKLPIAGEKLQLTLDAALQRVAYEAMVGKKGAVVASDPRTGEILALVSSPGFDPNTISAQYARLSAQNDLPFFNRAIGGVYAPGSTFKMTTTIAALSSGKVPFGFTWDDQGIIRVGSYKYTNWLFTSSGKVEGVIGFSRAIARSTDTFFYKVGEAVGPDEIADWARRMGFSNKTGVDLPGEVGGLVVDPEWKQKHKNESWFLGNTYQMAIGQGDTLVTPIQVNLMTNIIASGGRKCGLHLNSMLSAQCSMLNISPEILKVVRAGMVGACSAGGTAFPLFGFVPQVACKTGTAEYMADSGKIRTHGWLTAMAPADNPTISISVLVEAGGEGSNSAAPVVRKMLAWYFGVEDNYNYAAIPKGEGE